MYVSDIDLFKKASGLRKLRSIETRRITATRKDNFKANVMKDSNTAFRRVGGVAPAYTQGEETNRQNFNIKRRQRAILCFT
jgi:hypothetical protein